MAKDESPGSSRPVPDPTSLTTEQLTRAIESLRQILEARMDGRDEAVDLQFVLVEKQRVEQKADTKAAVDAALTAQKEAVREQTLASERAIAKSETATAKQLDQLATTFNTANVGLSTSLSDLKERVGRIESMKQGGQEQQQQTRGTQSFTVAVVAVCVTVVVAAVTIAGVIAANSP